MEGESKPAVTATQRQCLVEILSDNILVSRGVVQLTDTICNAEAVARVYLEKILVASSYFTKSAEKSKGSLKIARTVAVADLECTDDGRKHLSVSLSKGQEVDDKSYRSIATRYVTYPVPVYIPAILILLCVAIYRPAPDEVCFAHIGCLDMAGPWTQRIVFNNVPQPPALVNTTFILTSRELPNGYSFPATTKDPNVTDIDWNKGLNIIVHGFTDNTTTWVRSLGESLLEAADVNVLAVDWTRGADMSYPQSVANTRVVAAAVSVFLEYLTEIKGKTIGDIHIIGHSLGSHIAGYIGKSFGRVKRITALDPASPLFEGFDSAVRLTEEDAEEVVVLHTNVSPLGFGIRQPLGTVDIYANNGQDQHGCIPMVDLIFMPNPDRILNMREHIACSHRRAYELLLQAVRGYPLKAYPCPVSSILSNDTEPCLSLCDEASGCLDIRDPSPTSEHKVFYLPTSDVEPYCLTYVNVEARTCPHQKPVLQLQLKGFFDAAQVILHNGMLTEKQRVAALMPLTCGALRNSSIHLQLTIDSPKSFMMQPEACFSYVEVSYVHPDSGTIVRLRRKDVRIMIANQCSQVEFAN